jgi:hypothetical protein
MSMVFGRHTSGMPAPRRPVHFVPVLDGTAGTACGLRWTPRIDADKRRVMVTCKRCLAALAKWEG